ncbi:MAG TPA: hypothetical protein PKE04_05310 [Clostridia bacterium]|nr:hypothetical protein [Clostridia bacterium]
MAVAALLLVTLLAGTLFLPLDLYYERARLGSLMPKFNAAVSDLTLTYAQPGYIPLPRSYAYLSRSGGEVIVCGEGSARTIMFYTFRGILDNFSVYAYAPTPEAYASLTEYTDWLEVVQMRNSWYFCAHR